MILFYLTILFYFLLKTFELFYLSHKYFKEKINFFSISYMIYFIIDLVKYTVAPFYMINDIFNNEYFLYSVFIVNLGLIVRIFIIVFITEKIKVSNIFKIKCLDKIKISSEKIKNISLLFLLLFFINFFIVSRNFGIMNWIFNPRYGYQYFRTGVGSFYACALTCLSISLTLRMVMTNKKIIFYFWMIVYFFLVYLLGSKGRIIDFYIFIVGIGIYKKILKKKEILFLAFIIFLLLCYNLYTSYNTLNLKKFINYFDYLKNSVMYYKAYFENKISLFYGKIFITGFWRYIPRTFVKSKPFVYGDILIIEFFYPGLAAKTHTPSFGSYEIMYFADFGILGVILFSFFNIKTYLYAIGLKIIFKNKKLNIMNLKNLLIFIFIFSPRYGDYFPFGLQIILSILFIIVFYFLLKFK